MSKNHLPVSLLFELIIDDYVVQRSAAVNWCNGPMISKYARPGSTIHSWSILDVRARSYITVTVSCLKTAVL